MPAGIAQDSSSRWFPHRLRVPCLDHTRTSHSGQFFSKIFICDQIKQRGVTKMRLIDLDNALGIISRVPESTLRLYPCIIVSLNYLPKTLSRVFGIFIRKYKIDELSQLINVFIGNMTLVGPRPNVKIEVDLYNNKERRILLVKKTSRR